MLRTKAGVSAFSGWWPRGLGLRDPFRYSNSSPAFCRDRRSAVAIDVGRPLVHEPPPALEQVRTRIGGLDFVLDHVRERHLDNLARVIRFFGCPVPEGGPEPSPSVRAASRISAARRHSGTRCARCAFMRAAGMVHTRSDVSISAHSAPRTSPHRAAVSTSSSKPA